MQHHRRPGSRSRGVVACAALLVLAGCTGSSTPDLGSPDLAAADRAACEQFVAALPATLAQQTRLADDEVDGDGPGAAYGDPAIVVRCGVASPEGFDPTRAPGPDDPSPCTVVNKVGWYLPDDERAGDVDATLTAVSYAPLVSVEVPSDYLPEGSAAALAELAPAVTSTLAPAFACS